MGRSSRTPASPDAARRRPRPTPPAATARRWPLASERPIVGMRRVVPTWYGSALAQSWPRSCVNAPSPGSTKMFVRHVGQGIRRRRCAWLNGPLRGRSVTCRLPLRCGRPPPTTYDDHRTTRATPTSVSRAGRDISAAPERNLPRRRKTFSTSPRSPPAHAPVISTKLQMSIRPLERRNPTNHRGASTSVAATMQVLRRERARSAPQHR